MSCKSYVIDAIKQFINDPPDSPVQRGYLHALIAVAKEALELDPNDPVILEANELLKPQPKLSAYRVSFQRDSFDPRREQGIAITREYGVNDALFIIPDDATTPVDILHKVHDYTLDWAHPIDGRQS